MLNWIKYLATFAIILAGIPALAQTKPDSDGGEYLEYRPSEFSEVFRISLSPNGSEREYVLPETRAEWLAVAEKISSNQIDETVYYAFFRGDLPSDIFTSEFLNANAENIENWLLEKWGYIENEKEADPVVSVGPFVAYPDGAGENLGQYSRQIKCDPFYSGINRKNEGRSFARKIKTIRVAAQNAVACEHSNLIKD